MRRWAPMAVFTIVAVSAAAALAGGGGPKTKLVSKSSGGDPAAGGDSRQAVITPDGRFVAFVSSATNLPGDAFQVYVRDLQEAKTKLVSKTSAGEPGSGESFDPSMSENGRFVAFESTADNLPGFLGGGDTQIYLRDLKTGRTRLVSKTTGGEAGDGDSDDPSISGDGRRVAFESESTNLPSGLGNFDNQVYVRDLKTGRTRLVSKTTGGEAADDDSAEPSISRTGRFIAFHSDATNLPGGLEGSDVAYLRDLEAGRTKLVSKNTVGETANGDSEDPILSPNGRFVGFKSSGSTNLPGSLPLDDQAYLRDLEKSKTFLVSRTSGGAPASAGQTGDVHPSGDGRYVAFESSAANLPGAGDAHVYLRDRTAGKTRLLSRASDGSPAPMSFLSKSDAVFTAGVAFVVFQSAADNLPGLGEQVYIRGPLG